MGEYVKMDRTLWLRSLHSLYTLSPWHKAASLSINIQHTHNTLALWNACRNISIFMGFA